MPIIIEEVDGNCAIHVHEENGTLLITEIVEEDPLTFISRLRRAMDSEIIERQVHDGQPIDTPLSNSSAVTDNIKVLRKEIERFNNQVTALMEFIDEYDKPVAAFTDQLT